jgi:hypothetical protein
MARAKKTDQTDLQAKEAELKKANIEYEVFEYRHGFFDLLFVDEEGRKQKLEYRPDGSEIIRDIHGKEVQ